jgi:hypothetical protein
MPRAFVGLWMLNRDAAKNEYAKLAQTAPLGVDDANPLKVTEAQIVEAEEWVARAVGSGKQLMHKRGTRGRVGALRGLADVDIYDNASEAMNFINFINFIY